MLAFALDCLLRMLHPIIPFITEEIWQLLAGFCPDRGFDQIEKACNSLMIAKWSSHPPQWRDAEIENRFATFQSVLGAVREIRSRQNLAPRKEIRFSVRCDEQTKRLLEPMSVYFSSMAAAQLVSLGSNIESPRINAMLALPNLEVFVDLAGLIDVNAEKARLEKEKEKLDKSIAGKQSKLANEKFVNHAPAEIVQREREGLAKMIEQLKKIADALEDLK
jgi:valyl-tRNA synthetase